MSDPIDRLKNQWDEAKSTSKVKPMDSSELIALAQKKMKGVVYSHYGNIIVLTLTLIMISSFFYYITPFQQLLSRIGVALMVGGLALRIAIEFYSIYRSKQIHLSDSTATTNDSSVKFYAYRKRIHGPITVSILIAYTVGFYMLTPEFSDYLTFNQVLLIDISYLVMAPILIYSIRKGIKDEIRLLEEWTALSNEISKT